MRYPIGNQNFKEVINGRYVYADKTQFISMLLEGGKYYFLSRPRRFGKSLFLSTLEYFFRGERNLFKGLLIDSYDWDWIEYPVIHLDFNGGDYSKSVDSLFFKLNDQLFQYEKEYGLESEPLDISSRFKRLIGNLFEKTGRQVVVLIDEYEKPVLDAFPNEELQNSLINTLGAFYSVLKSCDKYLKLVFLTGVTKFGKLSIFSALNNLDDISMDVKYGSICGITEQELRDNFKEGIQRLAHEEGINYDDALGLLKKYYDGYHFNHKCPDIYNPFSLVSALSKAEIMPYWSATGTPSILAELLVSENYDLEKLNGSKATKETLLNIENQFDDPVSLFYQTGYLTIKDYDKSLRIYTLGFPNREVEVAFFNFITPYYLKAKRSNSNSYVLDFIEGINNGNPEKAMKALEAFSAGFERSLL